MIGLRVAVGINTLPVYAATTIVVNSTADDEDNDGECTLREAIIASNTDTASGAAAGECEAGDGNDTINFNITGTADFTNGGEDGYTISPNTALPHITETVTIDGYSQPGARANTSIAPNPLNGILLIEIDGSSAGATQGINPAADDSEIRGLVINRFEGNGINSGADDLVIQGNYLGTDPTGLIDRGNGGNGFAHGADGSERALIGGLNPEDRNLISGNETGGVSPNTDCDDWLIQGNYFGVDATGLVAMPNAQPGGSGAISLDNSTGHIVGGPEPTAINVISGNNGSGIAPNGTVNTTIENNYIGVGYDNITPVSNDEGGIGYSQGNSDILIKNNNISNNQNVGLYLADDPLSVVVTGNTITNNLLSGILIANSSDIVIGGTDISERNIISGNGSGVYNYNNIDITGGPVGSVSDVTIQGNFIGTDVNGNVNSTQTSNQHHGISIRNSVNDVIVGGSQLGEGNVIAGSSGPGVSIQEVQVTGLGTAAPTDITVIGNSIYSSNTGGVQELGTSGLGIELYRLILDGGFTPQSLENEGPTLNDSDDPDTGPNDNINFPVINSTYATDGSLDVSFDLDVDDSAPNGYRVEFFASETADPSGYGEGQIYLGSTDVSSSSNGNSATLTIPEDFTSGSYAISATTTEIDNSSDRFGATSEFSQVLGNQTILATSSQSNTDDSASSDSLADTGQNSVFISDIAFLFVVLSASVSTLSTRLKK